MNDPAPPPGFEPLPSSSPLGMFAGRRTRSASTPAPAVPPPPPGFVEAPTPAPVASPTLFPTGQAHDGDTFRLNTGQNARLYGVDAFELSQTGRTRSGTVMPLGVQARSALLPFANPQARVAPTGATTYNRPVVMLNSGGQDAGASLIEQGLAVAEPSYLRGGNQQVFNDYMQAERNARLNGRGAFQGTFQTPSNFRHGVPANLNAPVGNPWAKPEEITRGEKGGDVVWWDQPTPFQGLRPDIEKGYLAITMDPHSTAEQLLAYAKNNGFQVDPKKVDQFYREKKKVSRPTPTSLMRHRRAS